MIQSLHIFRKDLRHLWPDLSIYAALLFAFGTLNSLTWSRVGSSEVSLAPFFSLLTALVPLLWLVMIARLVQDESLVGDKQFWISRPYRWTSLLFAKLLFFLVCIVLPFALMRWITVLAVGLNPLPAISGEGLNLTEIALWVWLPLAVVASVTSTVQRMFMSVVAIVVFWGTVLTLLGNAAGVRMSVPPAAEAIGILIGALLIAIVVYQYATRNAQQSRIALIATIGVFIILFWVFVNSAIPGPVDSYIRGHYPVSSGTSLRLVFDPSKPSSRDLGRAGVYAGSNALRLPINIQGFEPRAQFDNQNVAFTIDAPGLHYTSPWRPANVEDDALLLFVPRQIMDRLHGTSVNIHVSEIAQHLLPATSQTVIAASEFSIPDNGKCRLTPNRWVINVICRYPFHIASPLTAQAQVTDGACGNPGQSHPGFATVAARSPGTGPYPIIGDLLRFKGNLCPGTPVTFITYRPGENFRLDLDIPSFSLDQYLMH